jgi:hypothetical protein
MKMRTTIFKQEHFSFFKFKSYVQPELIRAGQFGDRIPLCEFSLRSRPAHEPTQAPVKSIPSVARDEATGSSF